MERGHPRRKTSTRSPRIPRVAERVTDAARASSLATPAGRPDGNQGYGMAGMLRHGYTAADQPSGSQNRVVESIISEDIYVDSCYMSAIIGRGGEQMRSFLREVGEVDCIAMKQLPPIGLVGGWRVTGDASDIRALRKLVDGFVINMKIKSAELARNRSNANRAAGAAAHANSGRAALRGGRSSARSEPPRDFRGSSDAPSAGGGGQGGRASTSRFDPHPLGPPPPTGPPRLPQGWTEYTDPVSRRQYWGHIDGSRSWVYPPGPPAGPPPKEY